MSGAVLATPAWRQRAVPAFAAVLALALGGCATRGAIDFRCDGFESHVSDLPPSRLLKDIQSDGDPEHRDRAASVSVLPQADPELAADPMTEAITRHLRAQSVVGAAADPAPRPVLLLSGGGQWGAFGSSFLAHLNAKHGNQATDYGVITGVSTGGVQALFVAINQPWAYDKLKVAYSPKHESEIVDRHKFRALAALTGSMAGLAPLRKRIETRLCPPKGDPGSCGPIKALAGANSDVFVGFVEAQSGKFVYANLHALANEIKGPRGMANAQECLAAVAMASSAMPVFYQQLRINQKTYFDGGLRKSVFEAGVSAALERATGRVKTATGERATSPALYVIRNGPTRLLDKHGEPQSDPKANEVLNALEAAFRAEAIVVNELEVGSIAALRLEHPQGDLWLATADGYAEWPLPAFPDGCEKSDSDAMFEPKFMKCLHELGVAKADRDEPWIKIRELGLKEPPPKR